ncbi:MAG: rhodanese-like domain-containing protein [Gammaproteobacteria bacterium]|nr:rhodanese-like domain-containing protein [Gammaproteobacteria bacterium]
MTNLSLIKYSTIKVVGVLTLFLFMQQSGICGSSLHGIQEYLDFAEYSDGSISTEQLSSTNHDDLIFIDNRNKGHYLLGHIPGAINIEWREILHRRKEIPKDKTVILYCETGLLSSKAHFALRVAGWDNVKVLWGGYLVWSARQSFEDAALIPK